MAKSRALGTKLMVNSKQVGGLSSINGVEISADNVDLTAMDNITGYREKEPGFKDAGEVTASGFLDGDDVGQAELYNLLVSGDVVACQIIFPAKIGKTWSFNAGVSRFSTGADVDGAVTFDISLLVSGAATLANSTSAG